MLGLLVRGADVPDLTLDRPAWMADAWPPSVAVSPKPEGVNLSRRTSGQHGRMDLRERHIGRIAIPNPTEAGATIVDPGALIRRLLLFEHVTVETLGLSDLPTLVRTFGIDGVIALVKSPDVDFVVDICDPASFNNTSDGYLIPPGHHKMLVVRSADLDHYFRSQWDRHSDFPYVNRKNRNRLESALRLKAIGYPESVDGETTSSLRRDLDAASDTLLVAVSEAVRRDRLVDVGDRLRVRTAQVREEGLYRVETNLPALLGVSEQAEHDLVAAALHALAGLYQRLAVMDSMQSVTGFREEELVLFDAKLRVFEAALDPDRHESRLERVVEIAHLPSVTSDDAQQRVSIERVLEIRQTPECREFRRWLRTIDSESDEEIRTSFASLRERVAEAVHGGPGQAVRFVVQASTALPPPTGWAVGGAMSLADRFLADKVIGRPGPVTFIGKYYRSIFEERM